MGSRRLVRTGAALLLAALAAGCGTTPERGAEEPAPSDAGESATGGPTDSAEPTQPPSRTPEVRAAIEDLAERLDIDTAAVEVALHQDVTWPDGSLGCPQPGQFYTQALIEGTRLLLMVEGVEYSYHGGQDGELAYCADPAEPVEEAETA